MTGRPQAPGERLRTIAAAASALGVAKQTLYNLLSEHRETFTPRRFRGRRRVLTDAEIDALAALMEVRVKKIRLLP